MKTPPPDLLPLLADAAALRAAGDSWAAVGREVGRSPETCRRWPTLYAEAWQRLFAAAQAAVAGEADAEARFVLRTLLRSEQEKVRLGAAQKLLRPPGKATAKDADDFDEVAAFLHELRGLSDDERDRLIRRFLEADRGPAGLGDPPGPAVAE